MQKAENSSSQSEIVNMFGTFCDLVFQAKEKVSQCEKEIDVQAIYRSMHTFLKTNLTQEKNTKFNQDNIEIMYLMASLADDIFLNLEWSGKQFWEQNMLEQLLFNSQIAGEKVFAKIDELLADRNFASIDKIECYLKALVFGFEGKFRGAAEKQVQIDGYRKNLLEFIERKDNSMLVVGYRLFQKEYTYTIPTAHRKMLPEASIVNYVCAFFIFMFLVITSFIWIYETKDISTLLTIISTIALRE